MDEDEDFLLRQIRLLRYMQATGKTKLDLEIEDFLRSRGAHPRRSGRWNAQRPSRQIEPSPTQRNNWRAIHTRRLD